MSRLPGRRVPVKLEVSPCCAAAANHRGSDWTRAGATRGHPLYAACPSVRVCLGLCFIVTYIPAQHHHQPSFIRELSFHPSLPPSSSSVILSSHCTVVLLCPFIPHLVAIIFLSIIEYSASCRVSQAQSFPSGLFCWRLLHLQPPPQGERHECKCKCDSPTPPRPGDLPA